MSVAPPPQVSLSVEDPIDPNNDTARGSYNIKVVRQVRVCVSTWGGGRAGQGRGGGKGG